MIAARGTVRADRIVDAEILRLTHTTTLRGAWQTSEGRPV
jgi:hypothetical protein